MSETRLSNTHQLRVRYAETDKMGYAYNSNYLIYFETGRNELMRNCDLNYAELENKGFILPLMDAHLEYLNPASYDDVLDIRTELIYRGGVKIYFEYNIFHNDTNVCKGNTTHVFVSERTRAVIKPPKEFMEVINRINSK